MRPYYCMYLQYSPSGLYCATMVTVCPAFFRAAAACSWVALDKSTPFTYKHAWININICVDHRSSTPHGGPVTSQAIFTDCAT